MPKQWWYGISVSMGAKRWWDGWRWENRACQRNGRTAGHGKWKVGWSKPRIITIAIEIGAIMFWGRQDKGCHSNMNSGLHKQWRLAMRTWKCWSQGDEWMMRQMTDNALGSRVNQRMTRNNRLWEAKEVVENVMKKQSWHSNIRRQKFWWTRQVVAWLMGPWEFAINEGQDCQGEEKRSDTNAKNLIVC